MSRALTLVFAAALFLFGAVGGNMFQANQTFAQAREVTGGDDGFLGSAGSALVFGIVLALGVGLVILGGITLDRQGHLPPRARDGAALPRCLLPGDRRQHRQHPGGRSARSSPVPSTPRASPAASIGVLIIGFQRAAFSNEAGVGSAPTAHAAVKTQHPVSEGFVALLEPFIDTVIVCTATALTIVIADTAFWNDAQATVQDGGAAPDGVVVTSRAFETFLPQFPVVLAIAVALFAFSTLITWAYYSMKAWTTLFGRTERSELTFKIVFCLFTVVGTVLTFDSVLGFADAMLFVCAIVNLLACYLLLPKVREELRSFRAGIADGSISEVPVDERGATPDAGGRASMPCVTATDTTTADTTPLRRRTTLRSAFPGLDPDAGPLRRSRRLAGPGGGGRRRGRHAARRACASAAGPPPSAGWPTRPSSAARAAIARFVGLADPRGVVFGRSMTAITFDMARTLAQDWGPGDEVVVTRLDHDANIRPWVVAAERAGATVRWLGFDPVTARARRRRARCSPSAPGWSP